MFNITRRHSLRALTALAAAPLASWAENWPARPIRLIVAYPPGGVSDVVARALADKLAAQLGKAVVVENKAGASGTIGMDAVAKAAPDGYTFGFSATSPLTLSPLLGKLPYNPDLDVQPVCGVMYSPVLLVATPASRAENFRDMMGRAKDRPHATRWATSGQASLGHLMLAQLQSAAKVEFTHVPYKGGGQQITEALGGHFELLSVNVSPQVMQQIEAGKLRPLAVGAPARLAALPVVPTLAELGYPRANLASQFGVFAPGNAPRAVVDRLSREINEALRAPDLREKLIASGNVPTGGGAAEFAKLISTDYDNNAGIVRAYGIKGESQ